MTAWVDDLVTLHRARTPAVLVTVASAKGSVPRPPGTKMIVTADRLYGTIGGGHLEFVAIDAARRQLAAHDAHTAATLHRFALGASLGQCCGGVVNLLLEPVGRTSHWIAHWIDLLADFAQANPEFVIVTPVRARHDDEKLFVAPHLVAGTLGDPALDQAATMLARACLGERRPSRLALLSYKGATDADAPQATQCLFDRVQKTRFDIVLFGAGHVARALVGVLAALPCSVMWIDSREDAFPDHVPRNVRTVATDAPADEVDAAPAGSYFLVMTHSHQLDEVLCERILSRTDFGYFGLIGSVSKRRQFERRLEARGVPAERFERMTCPIGLPAVVGKEPGIIAVAVAAEMLARRAEIAAADEDSDGNGESAPREGAADSRRA